MLRGLRTLLRRRPRSPAAPDGPDPFLRPAGAEVAPPLDDDGRALVQLLDSIEATALHVYARAGLPTRAGHYRRGPGHDGWTHLAEVLTPQARFDLVLSHPVEQGWRHAPREELGRLAEPPSEALVEASGLLTACRDLRARLRNHGAGGAGWAADVQSAVRLGVAWRRLVEFAALEVPTPRPKRRPRRKTPAAETPDVESQATLELPEPQQE